MTEISWQVRIIVKELPSDLAPTNKEIENVVATAVVTTFVSSLTPDVKVTVEAERLDK